MILTIDYVGRCVKSSLAPEPSVIAQMVVAIAHDKVERHPPKQLGEVLFNFRSAEILRYLCDVEIAAIRTASSRASKVVAEAGTARAHWLPGTGAATRSPNAGTGPWQLPDPAFEDLREQAYRGVFLDIEALGSGTIECRGDILDMTCSFSENEMPLVWCTPLCNTIAKPWCG